MTAQGVMGKERLSWQGLRPKSSQVEDWELQLFSSNLEKNDVIL